VNKKTKKPRKPEKNNRKNRTVKKKHIKRIKILKKPAISVRFRFYKPKTEKTESNRTQTEKNQAKSVKNRAKPKKPSQTSFGLNRTEPKPVGLNRFRFFF
jgi:hypothetical protein